MRTVKMSVVAGVVALGVLLSGAVTPTAGGQAPAVKGEDAAKLAERVRLLEERLS